MPHHTLWAVVLACAGSAGLAPAHAQSFNLPMRPELGISPEQLAIAARRQRLPSSAKLECAALDTRLPRLARLARRAAPDQQAMARQDLQQARARFDALRC